MKKKVKARRLLALVLVAAVVLSVNTTVFAANESESEEPTVCTMDGSCEAEIHEEGCPYKEPALAQGGDNENRLADEKAGSENMDRLSEERQEEPEGLDVNPEEEPAAAPEEEPAGALDEEPVVAPEKEPVETKKQEEKTEPTEKPGEEAGEELAEKPANDPADEITQEEPAKDEDEKPATSTGAETLAEPAETDMPATEATLAGELTDKIVLTESEALKAAWAMIEKLPDAETVKMWMQSAEEHEAELAQLQAAVEELEEALEVLTPEEYEQIDLTKLASLMEGAEPLADTVDGSEVSGEMSGADFFAKAVDGKITLTGDVTLTDSQLAQQEITETLVLDLAEHTLDLGTNCLNIASNAKLSVIGNGTVKTEYKPDAETYKKYQDNFKAMFLVNGTLDIENGTFVSSLCWIVNCETGGQAIIHDGNFTCTEYRAADSILRVSDAGSILTVEKGTFTATEGGTNEILKSRASEDYDGYVYDGLYGVYVRSGGSLILGKAGSLDGPVITTVYAPVAMNNQTPDGSITIYGGTYTSTCSLAKVKNWERCNTPLMLTADATVTIEGGIFIADQSENSDPGSETYAISIPYSENTKTNLTIKGGEFRSTGAAIYTPGYSGQGTGALKCNISGGTFSSDISEYLSDANYTQGPDGKVVAADSNPGLAYGSRASVKGSDGSIQYYNTLKEAIDNAAVGNIITLLRDVTESVTIPAEKEIILDLNGFTLTGQKDDKDKMANVITNNGMLTIRDSGQNGTVMGGTDNGEENKVGRGGIALVNNDGAVCTIESGTIKRGDNNTAGNYTVQNIGTMYIKGGLITNNSNTSNLVVNSSQKSGVFGEYAPYMEISGGTLSQNLMSALKNEPNAYMKITGNATVIERQDTTNPTAYACNLYGIVEMDGGSIRTNGIIPVLSWKEGDTEFESTFKITGGSLECTILEANNGISGRSTETQVPTIIISGDANIKGKIRAVKFVEADGKMQGYLVKDNKEAKITVSGSMFTNAVPAYHCAEGFVPVAYADGSYGVRVATVAQIGTGDAAVTYGTLQEAVNAAQATQTSITLLANIYEDVVIPETASIVLDLNGFTLTNVSSHTITNKGRLTIQDSSANKTGTIDSVTHKKAAVYNAAGGEAILEGGTYTRSKENGQSTTEAGGNSYYTLDNKGRMEIKAGVKVTQNGHYSSMIENGWIDGSKKPTDAAAPELIISGGEFEGGLNTVKNDETGKLVISGGTFTNVSQYVVHNWNIAEISGGEFTSETRAAVANGRYNEYSIGQLTISGGTFISPAGMASVAPVNNYPSEAIEISGGSFSAEVNENYLTDEMAVTLIKTGDAPYSYFADVESAVNEAKANDRITLPAQSKPGYTFQGWISSGTATLIPAGEYTIASDDESFTAAWALNAPTTVTITGGQDAIPSGQSTMLTATAAHELTSVTYTYQWFKDGVAISGATASTLTVREAGSYTVAVSASDTILTSAARQSAAVTCTVTEPESTALAPTEPGTTAPTEQETTAPTEPETTVPAPTEPGTTAPTEPGTTAPAPTTPAPTAPAQNQPQPQAPAVPGSQEPAAPVTPVVPAGTTQRRTGTTATLAAPTTANDETEAPQGETETEPELQTEPATEPETLELEEETVPLAAGDPEIIETEAIPLTSGSSANWVWYVVAVAAVAAAGFLILVLAKRRKEEQ